VAIFSAANLAAAALIAGQVHADGGPAPLFLAPRAQTASDISTGDLEQASRERIAERAAAVSNPNLKWKPYRPAPKPEVAAERATTSEKVVEKPAAKSAKAKTKAAAKPAAKQSTVKTASAAGGPGAASRRASRIATEAESADGADAVADAAPAHRRAPPAPKSRLREEILQVGQREKADPFNDQFDIDQAPSNEQMPEPSTEPSPEPAEPNGNMENESPRTIPPSEDSFPDERLPSPSESTSEYGPPATAPSELTSCDTEKSECAEALKRLKRTGIDKVNINIAIAGREGVEFPCECELTGVFNDRNWSPTLFTWKASSLCHKPLYFEEVGLERYGHSLHPFWQPIFSGLHFFATAPALPYLMAIYPPNECQYVLGYYRMGDCAPYMVPPFPFSLRGAVCEAAAIVCPILIIH